MARFEDRLLNHPVHGSINELRATVAGLDDDTVDAANEVSAGALDRVPEALTYIEGALATAAPGLVTRSTLEAINSAITNANQTATNIAANPALTDTFETYIDAALDAVVPVVAASPLIADKSNRAATRFDTALTETVKTVSEQVQALSNQISELEEARASAESARAAEDEEREAALKATVDELTAQVAAEKQRLDSLVPTFETTFKDAQVERQAAFDEVQEELKTNAASVVTELKTSFEETVTKLTENSEAVLAEVEARRDEVQKLYDVITDTSTTGAFRDEAQDQKKAADRWRRIAVVFGTLAAVAAVGAVVVAALSPDTATSTSAIVGKITVTLAAAGVAAYAGRQSGRHRRREEESKRLELELVAFPPFIDSLEDEQKREVRKDFAERAFRGRPADLSDEGRRRFRKEDSVGIAMPELLQLVHDLVAIRDEKRQS